MKKVLFLCFIFSNLVLAEDTPKEVAKEIVSISINRVVQQKNSCVAYFMLQNKTKRSFSSLQVELIVFDQKDVISSLFLGDFKKVKKGKTLVKLFAIPKTKCPAIDKVLINDVYKCKVGTTTLDDCLEFIVPKPNSQIKIFK